LLCRYGQADMQSASSRERLATGEHLAIFSAHVAMSFQRWEILKAWHRNTPFGSEDSAILGC